MSKKLPTRFKNVYFWIGLLGVILAAMGVTPEMFTDWGIVVAQAKALISNPFMLGSVIIAVIGVIVDPTTPGIGDRQDERSDSNGSVENKSQRT